MTAPNADNRLFSNPDGSIQFVVLADLPLSEKTDPLDLFISQENGSRIEWTVVNSRNAYFFDAPTDHGTKNIICKVTRKDMVIDPGTYIVRVMRNGEEILNKSLTVRSHPVQLKLASQ